MRCKTKVCQSQVDTDRRVMPCSALMVAFGNSSGLHMMAYSPGDHGEVRLGRLYGEVGAGLRDKEEQLG